MWKRFSTEVIDVFTTLAGLVSSLSFTMFFEILKGLGLDPAKAGENLRNEFRLRNKFKAAIKIGVILFSLIFLVHVVTGPKNTGGNPTETEEQNIAENHGIEEEPEEELEGSVSQETEPETDEGEKIGEDRQKNHETPGIADEPDIQDEEINPMETILTAIGSIPEKAIDAVNKIKKSVLYSDKISETLVSYNPPADTESSKPTKAPEIPELPDSQMGDTSDSANIPGTDDSVGDSSEDSNPVYEELGPDYEIPGNEEPGSDYGVPGNEELGRPDYGVPGNEESGPDYGVPGNEEPGPDYRVPGNEEPGPDYGVPGNEEPGFDYEIPGNGDSDPVDNGEPGDALEEPDYRNDFTDSVSEKIIGQSLYATEIEKTIPEDELDQVTVITNENIIYDQIKKAKGTRQYYIKAASSGICKLELISAKDCVEYIIFIYEEDNTEESGYNCTVYEDILSEDVVQMELKEGKEYFIYVQQSLGFGGFELHISYPRDGIQDISAYDGFLDALKHENQQNDYFIEPEQDTSYCFYISELADKTDINLSVRSQDGTTYTGNKDGLIVKMQGGQNYEVTVSQYKGLGSYKLHMVKSIQLTGFTGAKNYVSEEWDNLYEVTTEKSGLALFRLLDMEEDLKVEISLYDEAGQLIDRCDCAYENMDGLAKCVEEGERLFILIRAVNEEGGYWLDFQICNDQ